jgi:GNAT superfamily N-acetyltransferase
MRAQRPALLALARAGGLVLARSAMTLVGGCTLSTERDPAWGSASGSALYLHKLVASRAAAGRDVGGHILRWCEAHAAAQGVEFLRLDCWDGSAKLRSYYRAEGFTELEAAPSHGYLVRLFERRVGNEQRG